MKAIKNDVEIQGMKNAHIRDAVALCHMLAILEEEIVNDTRVWTELDVEKKLDEFRSQQELFQQLSFRSSVAYGEHGGLPHYGATNQTNAVINGSLPKLLTIDSGGQYLGK